MRKDELIQLHTFLLHIRSFIEESHDCNNLSAFHQYESLDIGPQNVSKSKYKQKTAILELCNCISKEIGGIELSIIETIR